MRYSKRYLEKIKMNPLPRLCEDERIYLNVPYKTNQFAKATNCGFDSTKKLWFTGPHNTYIYELIDLYGINEITSENARNILKEIIASKNPNSIRRTTMKRVYDFLKKAGVYYLATVEGDQPRVRPFGTVNEFEGKLYIQTGKVKPTSKQLAVNPKAEICAFTEGAWVRIKCELIEDDRFEAKKSMLDAYPNLRGMYEENDGNTQVLYMKNAVATFSAFGKTPEIVEF